MQMVSIRNKNSAAKVLKQFTICGKSMMNGLPLLLAHFWPANECNLIYLHIGRHLIDLILQNYNFRWRDNNMPEDKCLHVKFHLA